MNMGVAIAVNDGVVAAVIPNAHTATLAEIATQRRLVADRARAGKLRPADIADATFTISNLGMYHVDQFTAIITPAASGNSRGEPHCRSSGRRGRQTRSLSHDDADSLLRSPRRRWRPGCDVPE